MKLNSAGKPLMTKNRFGKGFWVDDCPLHPGMESYCFP